MNPLSVFQKSFNVIPAKRHPVKTGAESGFFKAALPPDIIADDDIVEF
jgi:hypothetical protein